MKTISFVDSAEYDSTHTPARSCPCGRCLLLFELHDQRVDQTGPLYQIATARLQELNAEVKDSRLSLTVAWLVAVLLALGLMASLLLKH